MRNMQRITRIESIVIVCFIAVSGLGVGLYALTTGDKVGGIVGLAVGSLTGLLSIYLIRHINKDKLWS